MPHSTTPEDASHGSSPPESEDGDTPLSITVTRVSTTTSTEAPPPAAPSPPRNAVPPPWAQIPAAPASSQNSSASISPGRAAHHPQPTRVLSVSARTDAEYWARNFPGPAAAMNTRRDGTIVLFMNPTIDTLGVWDNPRTFESRGIISQVLPTTEYMVFVNDHGVAREYYQSFSDEHWAGGEEDAQSRDRHSQSWSIDEGESRNQDGGGNDERARRLEEGHSDEGGVLLTNGWHGPVGVTEHVEESGSSRSGPSNGE